jgi:hypothetical protein
VNDPIIEWITVALRIVLGSSLAIFGTIFAVRPLYTGYIRALRGWQQRKAHNVWKHMPPGALERIGAAVEQRNEVSTRVPPLLPPAFGTFMIVGGLAGSLGLVDVGTVVAVVLGLLSAVLIWLSMRTRASQGERRAAFLHRRVFPSWFNPLFLAVPLLQIPLIVVINSPAKTVDSAIVVASMLLGTAAIYIYARYSDRALFGNDPNVESLVDDDQRGTLTVFFSFFVGFGPLVYIAERILALGASSGRVAWFEAIVIWSVGAISGGCLKSGSEQFCNSALTSPPAMWLHSRNVIQNGFSFAYWYYYFGLSGPRGFAHA